MDASEATSVAESTRVRAGTTRRLAEELKPRIDRLIEQDIEIVDRLIQGRFRRS